MASTSLPFRDVPRLVIDVLFNNRTGKTVAIEFAKQVNHNLLLPEGKSWFCICRKLDVPFQSHPWQLRFRLTDPSSVMIRVDEHPATLSIVILPQPKIKRVVHAVAPGLPGTPIYKHEIQALMRNHTSPNCVNCACPRDIIDLCANHCELLY